MRLLGVVNDPAGVLNSGFATSAEGSLNKDIFGICLFELPVAALAFSFFVVAPLKAPLGRFRLKAHRTRWVGDFSASSGSISSRNDGNSSGISPRRLCC